MLCGLSVKLNAHLNVSFLLVTVAKTWRFSTPFRIVGNAGLDNLDFGTGRFFLVSLLA